MGEKALRGPCSDAGTGTARYRTALTSDATSARNLLRWHSQESTACIGGCMCSTCHGEDLALAA